MSSESSHYHPIEWRPSRILGIALVCMGSLAALSVCLAAISMPLKVLLAVAALAWSLRLARREAEQPPTMLYWATDGAVAFLGGTGDSARLSETKASVRAGCATVRGRDMTGQMRRLSWWPDTLPVRSRRLLRMAPGTGIVDSDPSLATMSG